MYDLYFVHDFLQLSKELSISKYYGILENSFEYIFI
jgi:hypothetical protein